MHDIHSTEYILLALIRQYPARARGGIVDPDVVTSL